MKRKRPNVGDIIEIETSQGLAYAHYTFQEKGRHGPLLRVLPGTFDERPERFDELVRQDEQFYTFYPLLRACREELVTIVAHEAIPDSVEAQPLMRQAGLRMKGHPTMWFLYDGGNATRIEDVTEAHKKLSVAEILNHEALISRIEKGYAPEDDV